MYLETTRIPATKTVGEITSVLAQAGAGQIMQTLQEGQVVAVQFELKGSHYRLPARVDPVFERLSAQRSPRSRNQREIADMDQATRVAWRQIFYWIKAQLALIETGMVNPQEVFLPYMTNKKGQTLYQLFADRGPKAPPVLGD